MSIQMQQLFTQRIEERTGVYIHTNGNLAGIWISVVDAVGPVTPPIHRRSPVEIGIWRIQLGVTTG
jgi:hypothetical protein